MLLPHAASAPRINQQLTMLDNEQSSNNLFDNCNYFETIGTKEMSVEKALVETFYFEVWNKKSFVKAQEILSEDFTFRGSLGDLKKGIDGFWSYVESVHNALSQYECIIEELVVSENQIAAKMIFKGIHKNKFFDVEPTGQLIQWSGAAFFKFSDKKISELWVLGDVDAIKAQLKKQ